MTEEPEILPAVDPEVAESTEPSPSQPAPSEPAPAVTRRSRLHIPLLSMFLVVSIIAIAATHRFWFPSLLATFSGEKSIPPVASAPSPVEAPPAEPPAPPPAVAPETQAAPPPDPAIQELRSAIDELQQRPVVDPQSIASLEESVRRLDDRLRGVEARLDQKEGEVRAERALTLAAGEISQALTSASPFEAPIAVIRSVAGNDPALADSLATLEGVAKTGVPSRWALSQKLADLAEDLAKPQHQENGGGFWDRALSRVSDLVTIRRERDADHPDAPMTPQALIAEAQRALVAGDLDAAIGKIQQIQGEDAARVRQWLDQATARRAAEQAQAALEAALVQRLAATGPTQ